MSCPLTRIVGLTAGLYTRQARLLLTVPETQPSRVRYRQRDATLQRLGYRNYGHYLSSPAWAAAKARYRASVEPQACMCGSEEVQIHHKTYERVGHEEPSDLLALCRICHAMVHVLERRGELTLDLVGFESTERADDYANGQAPASERARRDFIGAHAQQRQRRAQAAARGLRTLIRRYPDHPVLEFIEDVLAECDPHNRAV